MKRENLYNFDYARRIKDLESSEKIEVLQDENGDEVKFSPADSLLAVIYAPDERTGLPTGDLSYFVSDKVNPQVKEFILANLMNDVSSAANPAIPDGMDSSLAFDLMRQKDESIDDYRNRLNQFATDNVNYAKLLTESAVPHSEPSVSSE